MDQQVYQYQCPKCGNTAYQADQFQATGGNLAKIFDVQNKKFHPLRLHRALPGPDLHRLERAGLPGGGLKPPQKPTCAGGKPFLRHTGR